MKNIFPKPKQSNLYHVQTWELYPLVELTSRPFVFNNFVLIEKFSGKYCDGKFESVLINCFKKNVKFQKASYKIEFVSTNC
jgi:hypothetical protein